MMRLKKKNSPSATWGIISHQLINKGTSILVLFLFAEYYDTFKNTKKKYFRGRPETTRQKISLLFSWRVS